MIGRSIWLNGKEIKLDKLDKKYNYNPSLNNIINFIKQYGFNTTVSKTGDGGLLVRFK